MSTGSTGSSDPNDPQFLLNAIWFHWQDDARQDARARPSGTTSPSCATPGTAGRTRASKPFTGDDVYRAYDTAERLLRARRGAAGRRARQGEVDDPHGERRRPEAKEKQKATTAAPVAAEPLKGLAPWRTLVTPHPDVAAGRYRQAEFAADLAQVARGEGAKEYVDPREFFSRTYLTEGLRLLLTGALRRLTGTGGESVVDLQTTFGGGKTHSMLALWHLADPTVPVASLPGLEGVLTDAKVTTLPKVTRAAIVGTALSPITPRIVDGTEIRTLWGELAWQLGGATAFATVAEADRHGCPARRRRASRAARGARTGRRPHRRMGDLRPAPVGQGRPAGRHVRRGAVVRPAADRRRRPGPGRAARRVAAVVGASRSAARAARRRSSRSSTSSIGSMRRGARRRPRSRSRSSAVGCSSR